MGMRVGRREGKRALRLVQRMAVVFVPVAVF